MSTDLWWALGSLSMAVTVGLWAYEHGRRVEAKRCKAAIEEIAANSQRLLDHSHAVQAIRFSELRRQLRPWLKEERPS